MRSNNENNIIDPFRGNVLIGLGIIIILLLAYIITTGLIKHNKESKHESFYFLDAPDLSEETILVCQKGEDEKVQYVLPIDIYVVKSNGAIDTVTIFNKNQKQVNFIDP